MWKSLPNKDKKNWNKKAGERKEIDIKDLDEEEQKKQTRRLIQTLYTTVRA